MTLRELLENYLNGQLGLEDLDAWLSTYDWDAPASSEQSNAGGLYLLVTEISEGLRSEREVRMAVEELLEVLKQTTLMRSSSESLDSVTVGSEPNPIDTFPQSWPSPLKTRTEASTTATTSAMEKFAPAYS